MFAKSKVSQSMIDAVNTIISETKEEKTLGEAIAPIKEPTKTGMKVFGRSYGNSAKAKQDQTKSSVDDLKGPKSKDMKEELKGDQHKIDKNKNKKIDSHDFAILRGEKKVKEEMTFKDKLIESIRRSDIPAYLRKARGDTPLTPAEVKGPSKDAISHSQNLAKARNEEVENLEELKKSTLGSYVKKASKDLANRSYDQSDDENQQYYGGDNDSDTEKNAKKIDTRQKGINRAADKLTKEEIELHEKEMTGAEMKDRERIVKGMKKSLTGFKARYGADAKSVMYATATKQAMKEDASEDDFPITTDTLAGRMPGGKANSFKSYKVRTKPLDREDEVIKTPELDVPELSAGEKTIKAEATIAGLSGWKKVKKDVEDKSGAVHTPMSRARDLAQKAFKKVQDKTKIKD
jgi:hypothetical protein